jgi:hypothetical protein
VHPQHSVEPTAADWGSPLPDQAAKVAEDHKANRQDGHIVHARRTVEEQEHAIAGGRDAEFEMRGAGGSLGGDVTADASGARSRWNKSGAGVRPCSGSDRRGSVGVPRT